MVLGFLDIYGDVWPTRVESVARGNTVTVFVIISCEGVAPDQKVYYDFPRTTDGTVWGSRVIMFWW